MGWTSWTEVSELNTGRLDLGGWRTSSISYSFGGATTPNSENETETWNGTSWTEQMISNSNEIWSGDK